MSRSLFFLVAGSVLLCTIPLAAQDAVLNQLYGNGVHAYFGQDYVKAYQLFTSAIDGRTQDPRAFYFRGLTLRRLGRPQEAETDFQHGAKLESAVDPSSAFNVARALERIQGSDRAALEQYRLEARMIVLKKEEDEHKVRYQDGLKEQRETLQKQSESEPAKAVEENPKAPNVGESIKTPAPVTDKAPSADPFSLPGTPEVKKDDASGAKKPELETMPPGGEKPAIGIEKPATGDTGAGKKPAGGDPFAAPGDATKPATPDAGKDKKPAGGADLLGPGGDATKPAAGDEKKKPDAKPAVGENPFGAPDATKPAAPAAGEEKKPAAEEKKPAAEEKKPAATDDPFGGAGTAKPAAGDEKKKPDAEEKKPAAEEKKPAAEDKKPAASDDPFGGAGAAKPAAGDEKKKPDADEKKPAADEKKPAAAEEKKPAASDDPFGGAGAAKPAAGDEKKKPDAEEKKPAAEDKKPAAEEKKPAASDDPFGGAGTAKPAAGDEKKKPDAEEKKPAADEKKPAAEEKKPAAAETAPKAGDNPFELEAPKDGAKKPDPDAKKPATDKAADKKPSDDPFGS